jgi:mannose/fructose-specific phosphotransferase system component IIA
MPQIIIASHGGLSKGLLDSMKMVAGPAADGIETYSLLPGQNPNDYYEELRGRIEGADEQFIILCDIKGGSVHNALFRLTDLSNVILYSGVNMGMALEIALTAQAGFDKDAAERVLVAAQEGMTVVCGGASDSDDAEEDDEDF